MSSSSNAAEDSQPAAAGNRVSAELAYGPPASAAQHMASAAEQMSGALATAGFDLLPLPDLAATNGAQPTGSETDNTALHPVTVPALTEPTSHPALASGSDYQHNVSSWNGTHSHILRSLAAAVDHGSVSSSSNAANDSQVAAAGVGIMTPALQLAHSPPASAAQQMDCAAGQMVGAPATTGVRPTSAGAGLPSPKADHDATAVTVHTAHAMEVIPLAGLKAKGDGGQASVADSPAADGIQISAASEVQQPNKGKGRASAAALQRMAAKASKGAGIKIKMNKLTKLETYLLRVAYSEADFERRVLASKEAGAGPSSATPSPLSVAHPEAEFKRCVLSAGADPDSARSASLMGRTLHCAADLGYTAAGAISGTFEGLRRAFWRRSVT